MTQSHIAGSALFFPHCHQAGCSAGLDPVLHQLTPWGRQGLFHENLLESSGEEVGGTRSHARILHWRELCAVVYLSNDLQMLLSCVCWGGAYCQYILEMAFPHKVGVCAREHVYVNL